MTLNGEPLNQLTLFVEATHANRSAPQDYETEQTTQDTFGQNSPTPFAFYNPDTHSWKMSQDTLPLDLKPLSQTWPRAGMTHNGTAYQLPPLVHLTDVTGYLSLRHGRPWATPRAGLGDNRNSKIWHREEGAQNLENQLATRYPELIGQAINPQWVEWLMGFPIGWTDLGD